MADGYQDMKNAPSSASFYEKVGATNVRYY
jgi:hypothetical protein